MNMSSPRRDSGPVDRSLLARSRRVRSSVLAVAALYVALLPASGCGGKNSNSPGIDLGNPSVAWTLKTREERMGYMAARVHPKMEQLFVEYDDQWAGTFTCETCHGEDMELVDYRMPYSDLYPLPAENTIEESKSYDEEITEFMVSKVTPAMNKLLDEGKGPKANIGCLSCHPTEE